MKREKLHVVFNKRAVDKKLDELVNGQPLLTNSEIARAAMNIGLRELVDAKVSLGQMDFQELVFDHQDVQK
jgi:hypothetical protein